MRHGNNAAKQNNMLNMSEEMNDQKLPINEEFEAVKVEGLTIMEGEKVMLNVHLDVEMSLSDLKTVGGYIKAAFKMVKKEVQVYTVYMAKWTNE